MPVVATTVAVLGQDVDMPVVATTGRCSSRTMSLTCPLVCRQCCGPDVAENCGFPHLQFLTRWRMSLLHVLGGAAGSALAVVDVPVTMQRRCCLAHLRCLRFISLRQLRTVQLCNRDGYACSSALGLPVVADVAAKKVF